ncbi:MAG: hypothetical protein P8100_15520 [bacterium]
MKKLSVLFVLLLAVITVSAQDITGKWSGKLSFTGPDSTNQELRVNFNISATEDGFSSTLDSPDQDAYGIPVDSTIYAKPELTIKVAQLMLEYNGTLVDDSIINGKLHQAGQTLDLNLKKQE